MNQYNEKSEKWDNNADTPLVSVLIRTCGRPSVLREAIDSVLNQTYSNYEIIIVEDGPAISKQMLDEQYNLNIIRYLCTEHHKGRSYVGNKAMELAKGQYLNFLDDDDILYPNHLETLVNEIKVSKSDVVYAWGIEASIVVKGTSPYRYEVKKYNKRYRQKYSRFILCHHNFLPIQTVMFSKKLYDLYGGFDETLDYLEDWDMWLRYAMHTDFVGVEDYTSEYRVPFDKTINTERQKKLDEALEYVNEKHREYRFSVDGAECSEIYNQLYKSSVESFLNDWAEKSGGGIVFSVKKKIKIKIVELLKRQL